MKRTAIIAVVVMALVFGLVAYAGAVPNTVDVTATVKAQMEITVPTTAVMAGGIDPYTGNSTTVTVTGKSNKASFLTAAVTEGTFDTLTSDVVATNYSFGRGGSLSVIDTVSGTVDWSIEAGTDAAGSVLYTISQ